MIKFLAIFILVILALRLVNRLLFSPYIYTQPRPGKESHQTRKEGSVTLERNVRTDDKRVKHDEGEYVDYEEVK